MQKLQGGFKSAKSQAVQQRSNRMNYEENYKRNLFKPIKENPVILDFTGCKYLGEIHRILKTKFGLPEYYGENRDALSMKCDNVTNLLWVRYHIFLHCNACYIRTDLTEIRYAFTRFFITVNFTDKVIENIYLTRVRFFVQFVNKNTVYKLVYVLISEFVNLRITLHKLNEFCRVLFVFCNGI